MAGKATDAIGRLDAGVVVVRRRQVGVERSLTTPIVDLVRMHNAILEDRRWLGAGVRGAAEIVEHRASARSPPPPGDADPGRAPVEESPQSPARRGAPLPRRGDRGARIPDGASPPRARLSRDDERIQLD